MKSMKFLATGVFFVVLICSAAPSAEAIYYDCWSYCSSGYDSYDYGWYGSDAYSYYDYPYYGDYYGGYGNNYGYGNYGYGNTYGGYGSYGGVNPYNWSYPTGQTDLIGNQLCQWEGYSGATPCDFNPHQWLYDPYSGSWY